MCTPLPPLPAAFPRPQLEVIEENVLLELYMLQNRKQSPPVSKQNFESCCCFGNVLNLTCQNSNINK